MAAIGIRRVPLPRVLRELWQWWLGELAALVPAALCRRFARFYRRRLVLVVGPERTTLVEEIGGRPEWSELVVRAAGDDDGRPPAARRAVLRLDATAALRLPMALPLAAGKNLAQVIAFEFERHAPFRRDDVYVAHRRLPDGARAGRLEVELTIVRRGVVDAALDLAHRRGLRITAVEVAGGGGASSTPLPAALAPTTIGGRRAGAVLAALAGLAVLLGTAAVIVPLIQAKATITVLSDQLGEAKRRAELTLALRNTIRNEAQAGQQLVARKRQSVPLTELLALLTHLVPDDTWLTELQVNGEVLQLSGMAKSATALVGLLDRAPDLANAAFRSPVTQDPQLDRERFDMTVQIRKRDE